MCLIILGDCHNWPILGSRIQLKIKHYGTNGWKPAYIRVKTTDNYTYHCANTYGKWLDNNGVVILKCY